MKQAIILLFLITHFAAFGQFPKNEETGKVVYTGVVELPDMEKKAIYDKAKLWIVSTLKSGDNMVELEGSGSDQVVGTGNLVLDSILMNPKFPKALMLDASLNFKFLVFCKDGKLKYSVENFLMSTLAGSTPIYHKTSLENLEFPPQHGLKGKNIDAWKTLTEAYVDRQISALIEDFKRKVKETSDNDW